MTADPGYIVIWINEDDPFPYRHLTRAGSSLSSAEHDDAAVFADEPTAWTETVRLLTEGIGAWVEPVDHINPVGYTQPL